MNKRVFVAVAVAVAAIAGVIRSHAGTPPEAASAALHVVAHSPEPLGAPEPARAYRGALGSECKSPRRRRTRKSSVRFSDPRARRMASEAPPVSRVDLNRADVAELETLPGIGRRLAERIVAFREQNGPFAALDDLLDVNGVSERVVDALEPYAAF